jgi:hypothetical protein
MLSKNIIMLGESTRNFAPVCTQYATDYEI